VFDVLKWLKFSELGGKLEVDAFQKRKNIPDQPIGRYRAANI
jgi:hypothetical protein